MAQSKIRGKREKGPFDLVAPILFIRFMEQLVIGCPCFKRAFDLIMLILK